MAQFALSAHLMDKLTTVVGSWYQLFVPDCAVVDTLKQVAYNL